MSDVEIIWSDGKELAGEWRKVRTEELHCLYCSTDGIGVMK
jgi:hypothetical protein